MFRSVTKNLGPLIELRVIRAQRLQSIVTVGGIEPRPAERHPRRVDAVHDGQLPHDPRMTTAQRLHRLEDAAPGAQFTRHRVVRQIVATVLIRLRFKNIDVMAKRETGRLVEWSMYMQLRTARSGRTRWRCMSPMPMSQAVCTFGIAGSYGTLVMRVPPRLRVGQFAAEVRAAENAGGVKAAFHFSIVSFGG